MLEILLHTVFRAECSYLGPGRRRDLDITLIEKDGSAIEQVNAKGYRNSQTPFIPESSRHTNIVTLSKFGDGLADSHCKKEH